MNKLFIQLLNTRGLTPSFLDPKYEGLTDPFVLPDMKKATNRIKEAIKNREKILIYGDYDVDGITASVLMEDALKLAGVDPKNIHIMLPNRFIDGYGMSPKLIQYAKKQGITLVITVDCGSRNHEIIDELNSLKIDSIITDHHETSDHPPEALATINPKRKDFTPHPSLFNLAGVGVAFKLAEALVREKLIKNGQEKWLLDLVLIGTICDNMILTDENRILCRYGLKVIEKTRRPGLRELIQKARIKKFTSDSIGFQIGPRLNAAGRLETADIALSLLRTTSPSEAAVIGSKLEGLNQKRKSEQLVAAKEIDSRGVSDDPVIIETGAWHEGILGIIAGRLVEKYQRPTFVLTETKDDILKGSGRSFGDFSLAEALAYAQNSIISGGGHAGAAGVKLEKSHLCEFREKINEYYRSLHLVDQAKYLKNHADLEVENLSDFSLDLLDDLKSLEPFGAGNEEPIFCLKNIEILESRKMGSEQNHLRLDVRGKDRKILKLVAFFAPENWLRIEPGEICDILVKVTENEWNGTRSVEARIVDIL